MDIFEYQDYKAYILDQIASSPDGERGKRRLLAESMGCQVSYVTTVLKGSAHFSPEQATGCAEFFNLNEIETEFFLLLLQFARAGTRPLQKIYARSIERIRQEQGQLKNRLKMKTAISLEHQIEHYSSWDYGAVHILLSIPEYQTRAQLIKKLGLNPKRIDKILKLLVDSGLAKKKGQKYEIGESFVHLRGDSDLIARHHTNWRFRSIREFEEIDEESLHYSGAVSLSAEDFHQVRKILSNALTKTFKKIRTSNEEEGAVLVLDWYRL